MQKSFTVGIVLALVFTSAGCKDPRTFEQSMGTYHGVLLRPGASPDRQIVRATIKGEGPKGLKIEVRSLSGNSLGMFQAQILGDQKISLNANPLHRDERGCFSDDKTPRTSVCLNSPRLDLVVGGNWTLIAEKNTSTIQSSETPSKYTLAELVERARNQSFKSRVEFEQVLAARSQLASTYGNLAPHFNSGTVLTLISASPLSIIGAIGDLMPFLFPDNQWEAVATAARTRAEEYTWQAIRLDAMNTVEGIGIAIGRDQAILLSMEKSYVDVARVRDEVLAEEAIGLTQKGQSTFFDVTMSTLEKGISEFRASLKEEYTSLAVAAGFVNQDAILGMDEVSFENPEAPPGIDRALAVELAIEKSVELHQTEELIRAAKADRQERFYKWINPSAGGVNTAMGFGFASNIAVGTHNVAGLRNSRDSIVADVSKKVSDSLQDLERTQKSYEIAIKKGVQLSELVDFYLSNVSIGVDIVESEFANVLQQKAQNDIDRIQIMADSAMARSRLNRLLLEGVYRIR